MLLCTRYLACVCAWPILLCNFFPGDTLVPSYQTCFPELITVAPTNISEPSLNVQETPNITVIIAGAVSAVAVLSLLVIILMVSLVSSISLWRRAQRKKWYALLVEINAVIINPCICRKWDARVITGNSGINGSNSMCNTMGERGN